MATMPVRIDKALFETARDVGSRSSRSATQQLQHWAQIGMELDTSPLLPHAVIEAIRTGGVAYDDLPDSAQAAVRVHWTDEITRRRDALNLAAEFSEAGVAWAEVDADGRLIRRGGAPGS